VRLVLESQLLHKHDDLVNIFAKECGKYFPFMNYGSFQLTYEGRLKGSWTGGSVPLLCKGRR
jgi:hypothetical protein